MAQSNKLTTISQLGSRLSICKIHVRNLLRFSPKGTEHIFYIVDDKNLKLNEYASSVLTNHGEVFFKKENPVLIDKHRTLPPLGGDKNYDWLIEKVKTNYFLTLHDDTIIFNVKPFNWILKKINEGVDFGGFTDGRVHTNYNSLLYKNEPFTKLRIGTWFLFGNTNEFRSNKMSMGLYKNIYKPAAKFSLKSKNVSTLKFRQWVNGGFPFNIQIRDLNFRLAVEEYDDKFIFKDDILHKEKVTGFFVARNLIDYVDTDQELSRWNLRWETLTPSEKKFDRLFLSDLSKFINDQNEKDEGIQLLLERLID
ncbi:MAG: hypothetical protein ACON42_04190 [Flavobacteriaceae bacterium]